MLGLAYWNLVKRLDSWAGWKLRETGMTAWRSTREKKKVKSRVDKKLFGLRGWIHHICQWHFQITVYFLDVLASVISALKNIFLLHSLILQLEYWISDLFWLRHIVVSDLLKSWFHLCFCQMPDYLPSPISLHLKNCPSFLTESFLLVCHRGAFLTTCLSDHYNWQAFTFYSTSGKQLPYGKHILFDVWFIQELILVVITVSHSGLLVFFLYFPAGLFEA